MKKNKLMRIASVLLVATLLSTSVISGTFAKYVTTDEAQDAARVAKFGVVASVIGDLYGQTYLASDNDEMSEWGLHTPTVSINSTTEGDVVAPGTKNTKGMNFAITGAPEVSTAVHFDYTEDGAGKDNHPSTITLGNYSFGVLTEYRGSKSDDIKNDFFIAVENGSTIGTDILSFRQITDSDTFASVKDLKWYDIKDKNAANGSQYQPMVYSWTLHAAGSTLGTGMHGVGQSGQGDGNIFAAYSAISGIFEGATFDPNASNAISANLTWAWEFGDKWKDEEATENYTNEDKMDTILGDMIALASSDSSPDYYIVVLNATTTNYDLVKYKSVACFEGYANFVTVAYDAKAEYNGPAFINKNGIVLNTNTLAVLTEFFGARIIVEQVD